MLRATATAIFLTATALHAGAQEFSAPTDVELLEDARINAEEESLDWHRRFLFSSRPEDEPLWQGVPERDVGFSWAQGERLQLNVDFITRPETSPFAQEEMSAGATLQITPRFSIGGEVTVRTDNTELSGFEDKQQPETGIRLQSAFKF